MLRKSILYLLALLAAGPSVVPIFADAPDWVKKVPFTEDAFWGVGEGASSEEAEAAAGRDILMQLSSRVKAVVTMEQSSLDGELEIQEDLDAYFEINSLRGAELEDSYVENGRHWALMKYCDDCGDLLIHSALIRFEDVYEYDTEVLTEKIKESIVADAVQVERRLKDLRLEDYQSEDIQVRLDGHNLLIMILNFLPDDATLTQGQIAGLETLSKTLLEELEALDYQAIEVVGHANPTGVADERPQLTAMSRNRAETMAVFFSKAGIVVDMVSWKGGDETIGDVSTPEGRSINRRVEVIVRFQVEG